MFEDKLEVDYQNLYQNKSKKRCHTLHVLENKDSKPIEDLRTNESIITSHAKEMQSTTHRTPKRRELLVQSARKQPLIYFN